ncbi:MAG: glycosyltransferase family 2 protein [Bacteroidales bacterium]|nr:glycosyltransferase family 2 protein [Bacteroidales bacterium]
MKTAVVILNWNTEGFLRDFLPGLLRSCEKVEGAKVIVADNASTDSSLKVMEEEFPQVRTLRFEKNLGFTGGYNRAFAQLSDGPDAPEYFLLINSDIEVPEEWLGPLVDWMDAHPECGACAPKLHSWQEREKFEYAGAAGGFIDRYGYPFCRGRIMGRLETDMGQYDSPADVFWATGACLMVRSSVYRMLGGLDNRFFAHMEEIDMCWRMQLEGWKVTVVPASTVYHVGGGTLPATSPFKLFLNFRNNLLMLSNNLSRTFALGLYHKGMKSEKAAVKGMRMARRLVSWRMMLDRLSATVYLATFRIDCFKAVLKAHKEYRKLRRTPSKKQICSYLDMYGTSAEVKGIYRKWIVLLSMLKGPKVFGSIRTEDFYKF